MSPWAFPERSLISRGYIQEWGKGQAITERSAQRIFRAADQILRSGRTEQATRDAG